MKSIKLFVKVFSNKINKKRGVKGVKSVKGILYQKNPNYDFTTRRKCTDILRRFTTVR